VPQCGTEFGYKVEWEDIYIWYALD